MQITRLGMFKVKPGSLIIKVETNEGFVGWGQPVVRGRASTIFTAIEELFELIIGKNPLRIENIWQTLHGKGAYQGGPIVSGAISGIEQALWDIKGHYLGIPVHGLLGGAVKQTIRAHTLISGSDVSEISTNARRAVNAGYTAVKFQAPVQQTSIDRFDAIDATVRYMAGIRREVGKHIDIIVNFHGQVSKAAAKTLVKELEPLRPLFIEDPVSSENAEALKEVARHTTIPLATGHHIYTRWDLKRLLEIGCIDVIQPNVSYAGGIWEMRKMGAMAEAYDMFLAPSSPNGLISLLSSLHVAASTPNALIQEQNADAFFGLDNTIPEFVMNPHTFVIKDGHFRLPSTPGLGIDIDHDLLQETTVESQHHLELAQSFGKNVMT